MSEHVYAQCTRCTSCALCAPQTDQTLCCLDHALLQINAKSPSKYALHLLCGTGPSTHMLALTDCKHAVNSKVTASSLQHVNAGFDCASEWEADTVLGLGVPSHRIVFANACKRPCDIRFAAAKGLNLTTFDTDSELHKLARWHPATDTLLRIRADDTQVGLQCS